MPPPLGSSKSRERWGGRSSTASVVEGNASSIPRVCQAADEGGSNLHRGEFPQSEEGIHQEEEDDGKQVERGHSESFKAFLRSCGRVADDRQEARFLSR